MASNGIPPTEGEITVLVTGFGFYGSMPITAGMIAPLLPPSLPKNHPLNPSRLPITILGPQADYARIPAELGATRTRIKQLHDEHGSRISLWVHLGQWQQDWIACERRAFRQDFSSTWNQHTTSPNQQQYSPAEKHYYLTPDSVGQVVDDLGENPWEGRVPMGLHSEVPVDQTVAGANGVLGKGVEKPLVVRSHVEAGAQGCGFIFYESMANCFVNGQPRHVLFVHVPPQSDRESLERARDAVVAVIGSAVKALVDGKPESKEEKKMAYSVEP